MIIDMNLSILKGFFLFLSINFLGDRTEGLSFIHITMTLVAILAGTSFYQPLVYILREDHLNIWYLLDDLNGPRLNSYSSFEYSGDIVKIFYFKFSIFFQVRQFHNKMDRLLLLKW